MMENSFNIFSSLIRIHEHIHTCIQACCVVHRHTNDGEQLQHSDGVLPGGFYQHTAQIIWAFSGARFGALHTTGMYIRTCMCICMYTIKFFEYVESIDVGICSELSHMFGLRITRKIYTWENVGCIFSCVFSWDSYEWMCEERLHSLWTSCCVCLPLQASYHFDPVLVLLRYLFTDRVLVLLRYLFTERVLVLLRYLFTDRVFVLLRYLFTDRMVVLLKYLFTDCMVVLLRYLFTDHVLVLLRYLFTDCMSVLLKYLTQTGCSTHRWFCHCGQH
jgi:hypothetical protein